MIDNPRNVALASSFTRIPSFLVVFAALTFLSLFTLPALADDASGTSVLRILHISDLSDGRPDENGESGMARLKTLLADETQKSGADRVMITFGGDMLSPSPLSSIDFGTHMVYFASDLGVELAVVGNHEFDYGVDVLKRQLKTSPFLWLGANVKMANGDRFRGLAPRTIRKVGPYHIGFVGLISEDTSELVRPSRMIEFTSTVETGREQARRMLARGADAVIALTHQDIEADKRLLDQVPEILMVLGGHDHKEVIWRTSDGRLLIKPKAEAGSVALVELSLSGQGDTLRRDVQGKLIENKGYEPDPTIAFHMDAWETRLDSMLTEPIAKLGSQLDARESVVRSKESTMGNLVADAMRDTTKAQIALLNGGAIRSDRVYPAGHLFTKRDVMETLPFGNSVGVSELTGAQICSALEHGLSQTDKGSGQFLQVSGLSVTWDPNKPSGQRLISAQFAGKPIDRNQRYRVAMNDFMALGGGGFDGLDQAPIVLNVSEGPMLVIALGQYLRKLGTVSVSESGRIKSVSQ